MNEKALRPITDWLPITKQEMEKRGWSQPDVILITGDAYVDHPAFGTAVIGRVLEHAGLTVAIIPQPNWQDDLRDFKKFGTPRLFFGISSGNMDSMVNHYTANKRLRSDDAYTPDNKAGFRPDYALTVYSKIIRELFPEAPIIIGGIEASLRRFTHYDYWSDELKQSVLAETKADLLVYGMGEQAILEIATRLNEGEHIAMLKDIPQTAYLTKNPKGVAQFLPDYDNCTKDKRAFAEAFKIIETESNRLEPSVMAQKQKDEDFVVVNPTYPPMETEDLDEVYDLPYTRMPHPKYKKRGAIPAYEMIRHSVNIHRGCFGGCAFCTISAHQGKFIASRSEESVLNEVKAITEMDDYYGTITDLGGPSANMYRMKGIDENMCRRCRRPSCIYPNICKNLNADHQPLTALYAKARKLKNVKHVFIGSGIRYDMLIPKNHHSNVHINEYTQNLIKYHVSGRLKVAPEHTSDDVLNIMRKGSFSQFHIFKKQFDKVNKEAGLKQQLIPYFISSHPGSKLVDMAHLAAETKAMGFRLEQIQDFTPTPMTLATVMFYTGLNPYTGEPVYTAKSQKDKKDQRIFFFWYKGENRHRITSILQKEGRGDLAKVLLNR
ncbi:MAG: YgiQ family radical SAM protein [Marinilabiliales bacterium]|nr:MAG: YgiQ family radical SAM protein [Marinilabiliales bacterium]